VCPIRQTTVGSLASDSPRPQSAQKARSVIAFTIRAEGQHPAMNLALKEISPGHWVQPSLLQRSPEFSQSPAPLKCGALCSHARS